MLYYGKNISYPIIGVHDYIIVQPQLTNVNAHGFSVYGEKMYSYLSVGEIHPSTKEYEKIDESWILGENESWDSKVLDIRNPDYREFLFKEMIEPRLKEGFQNFFFDTLDSYNIAIKTTKERAQCEKALAGFIKEFKLRHPKSKLIINRGFEIIDDVYESVEAVLFESYHYGLSGKNLTYRDVSKSDKKWLDERVKKIQSYGLDVIAVDYLSLEDMDRAERSINVIKKKGMIPYVATKDLNTYGKSSKNALKREVLTLIDESKEDRAHQSVHKQGALPLEYLGYVQKLREINREGFPTMEEMTGYAGVVVWLSNNYESPAKLIDWVVSLKKLDVKVAFAGSFGINLEASLLNKLGVKILENKSKVTEKVKIADEDDMMGFEIEPSINSGDLYLQVIDSKPLLTFENKKGLRSSPAAITTWGGYAIENAFMINLNDDGMWIINPFEFFSKALRLPSLIVPDPSTENGKRLLFTHIDGDGIMNVVEWNTKQLSGDVILWDILKKYKIPHSVSLIGAEIDKAGLFPKISDRLQFIAKEMYKLENVEAATHTFTHPYFWGKIENGDLSPEYRLKVKDYDFSLHSELIEPLDYINTHLTEVDKEKANTVFWTGDCIVPAKILDYAYKNGIYNINGGDTWISNTRPWISNIAPLGMPRSEYYQVYTGAQNENIFTNDWLGPFWGFKKVVQTFKLTNSPRRYKPIDVYYHMYSGSKKASLNALRYVFNWAVKQDVMPIFTSDYIPKAMDYFVVSMAKNGNDWLVHGMNDLKTLRMEKEKASIDFEKSKSTVGIKHFENHTYFSLDDSTKHLITTDEGDSYKNRSYLISANAKIVDYKNGVKNQSLEFSGHVDLKLSFNLTKDCRLDSTPKPSNIVKNKDGVHLYYSNNKKAKVDVLCR